MLSKRQIRILQYLYPSNRISEDELKNQFRISVDDTAIKALSKNRLIFIDSSKLYQPKLIYLTEKGVARMEHILDSEADKKFHEIHEWINTIIALAALLAALFR